MSAVQSKICHSCGRKFDNRKKWKNNWEEVKYCSIGCKKLKTPKKYRQDILDLLEKRESGKSICPSEILPQELKKNSQEMEQVRAAARLLAHEGEIIITQKGKEVDPSDFKGPIRLVKKTD